MSVQQSPLLSYCVLTEGQPPTRTQWSALSAIGCKLWSDAGFPACPFNKSRSLDQRLSDRLLYPWTECRPVSIELDDIQTGCLAFSVFFPAESEYIFKPSYLLKQTVLPLTGLYSSSARTVFPCFVIVSIEWQLSRQEGMNALIIIWKTFCQVLFYLCRFLVLS